MSADYKHFQVSRDGRGVATVVLDVQNSPVNVFADEVVQELIAIVDSLERDVPQAVVFRSNKPTGFLAGADVKRIQKIPTPDEARAVQLVGQQLFDRVEKLPCPTIAAIHGVCLGGGLEFALSCRHRVARDDSQTKIGLPEVQLGLIPGWGGTQRLPRLVGLQQALRMILESPNLSAAKAAAVGLVDLAARPESFEAQLQGFIEDRIARKPLVSRSRGFVGQMLDGSMPGRAIVMAMARRKTAKKGRDYPALPAALRAVSVGLKRGHEAGLAAEREEFPALLFGPVSRNLIDLFFRREQARKPSTWAPAELAPRKVRKAAVVGAGTMGAGIAQLLAFNGIPVVLKDINDQIANSGKKKVEALTNDAAAKGVISKAEADVVMRNVTATSEWTPLGDADLVIEAVIEREDVKRDVFRQLGQRLGPNAVLASNTSALSITRLADGIDGPGRVGGLHFFNPVHKMHLVEVVRGRSTDDETVATLVELVRKVGKVPVVVADSPGFLVNRILFPYLDEAVRLVLEGIPGEMVDREAVRFGMPMGPLELLDVVGIDVAADVSTTLGTLRSELGPTPERLAAMAREGSTGQKSGRGFYLHTNGKKGKPTHWATPTQTPMRPGSNIDASGLTLIQRRLIYSMINEAAKCLDHVIGEAWALDLAMVLGTGFAPFRGGPLHTADSIGLQNLVNGLQDLARTAGARYEPCPLLTTMASERKGFFTERAGRAMAGVGG
jgi:3-hydroxyacyl-CoA dehydrogenase/enoyl-CoA hydratase/3-hydroxybutyryl-CoA epimerase